MSPVSDVETQVALHAHRISTIESSVESISKSLEKLTQLEAHHRDASHSIQRIRELVESTHETNLARLDAFQKEIAKQDMRIRQIEEADIARKAIRRSFGWVWGAVGGLVVIEVWRYLGGS